MAAGGSAGAVRQGLGTVQLDPLSPGATSKIDLEVVCDPVFRFLGNSDFFPATLHLSSPAGPGFAALEQHLVFPVIDDSDGDGIPDVVELELGLNPDDPSDAMGDLDGDGASNLAEHRAGTDPKDPGDRLVVFIGRTDSGLLLRFRARPNRTYELQSAASLDGQATWMPVAHFRRAAEARDVQTTLSGTTEAGVEFFRLVQAAIEP
jgi:hypothetical protein